MRGEREMSRLVPGSFVRHPDRPDWGVGQVQSVIGQRVTVNFENAGKLLINGAVIVLEPIDDDRADDER
jgi:transcription elongation factor GreA-like protein